MEVTVSRVGGGDCKGGGLQGGGGKYVVAPPPPPFSGGVPTACQEAGVRYKALEAYPDVPSPVWVLGFPKGRRGAATNLENSALGSAERL